MGCKTLSVGLVLLLISAVSAVAGQIASEWYVNMRFAYSIACPKGVFMPQGESADAGGQKFLSGDGKALVAVYGYNAPANHTLTTVYNETLSSVKKEDPGSKVTHKSLKNNIMVIKGTQGDNGFIKKVVYKPTERQFVRFEAVYPVSKSAYYEPVIWSMSDSLKMLQGPDTGK